MAEDGRMTVAGVVANVLAGEHGDFVREAVAIVACELMEAEVSAEIGAGYGEVSAERTTRRDGYRQRGWETGVGEGLAGEGSAARVRGRSCKIALACGRPTSSLGGRADGVNPAPAASVRHSRGSE